MLNIQSALFEQIKTFKTNSLQYIKALITTNETVLHDLVSSCSQRHKSKIHNLMSYTLFCSNIKDNTSIPISSTPLIKKQNTNTWTIFFFLTLIEVSEKRKRWVDGVDNKPFSRVFHNLFGTSGGRAHRNEMNSN